MVNKNHSLFIDPSLHYPKTDSQLSFAHYIMQCRELIKSSRLDLNNNPDAQKIIDANCPFELKPQSATKRGILLIHGLYDSPFSMRDLGNYFQSQGLLVRSVLLPGHGTVPGALLNVTYEEWIETVNYGVESLRLEVDEIFIGGFSTGGTLALYYALTQFNNPIAGLILIAPAITIASSFTFMSDWHKVISWKFPRAAWLGQLEENDYSKYQSCTFNSIYQIYKLCNQLKKITLEKISQPLFITLPQNDKTVCSDATLKYFSNFASLDSTLIMYSNQKKTSNDARIIFRESSYPQLSIEDFSHISLPTHPENFHYGAQGDYIFASHVYENLKAKKKIIYDCSNTLDELFSKTFYQLGFIKNLHLRLTFNPDFAFLTDKMNGFINKHSDSQSHAK